MADVHSKSRRWKLMSVVCPGPPVGSGYARLPSSDRANIIRSETDVDVEAMKGANDGCISVSATQWSMEDNGSTHPGRIKRRMSKHE